MARPTRYTPEMISEYTSKGYWTAETCVELWERCAREYPEKEALKDGKTRLTWSEAGKWIDHLALGFLELGFERDDVLVVQLPNCVELALLRVACEKSGILCLPILRTLRRLEVEHIVRSSGAKGIVIPREFRDFDYFQMVKEISLNLPTLKHIFVVGEKATEGAHSLKEMVDRLQEKKHPQDYLQTTKYPATEFSLILHTSGTTGFPKFVEYPICALIYQAKTIAHDFEINNEDVFAILGPAAAGPNARAYMCAPLVGARIVMEERFETGDALKLIEKERVTITGLVPAQMIMMLSHPDFGKYNLGSLRIIFSTGAALPYDWGVQAEAKTGARVVQLYGSVDWGNGMCSKLDAPQDIRLRTVGQPCRDNEVKLVDEKSLQVPKGEVGRIMFKGPSGSSGYFRNPEATWQAWTKDGWFNTGDLGRFDDQGNLVIIGRQKDVIIRGGQNIYPAEIENLLIAHPRIAAVSLVAMPDPVLGEKACAYVVPKGDQELTFQDLLSFLREKNIAPYKLPERLEVVEKLPLIAEQKVDKKALELDIKQKLKAEGISVS